MARERIHTWRESLLISLMAHQSMAYEAGFVPATKIVKSTKKYIGFLDYWRKENEISEVWTHLIHTYAMNNPKRQKILQPFLKDIVMKLRPELRTASERNLAMAQWELLYLAAKGHKENIEILREAKASDIASRHLEFCQKRKNSIHISKVIHLLKMRPSETELVTEPSSDESVVPCSSQPAPSPSVMASTSLPPPSPSQPPRKKQALQACSANNNEPTTN